MAAHDQNCAAASGTPNFRSIAVVSNALDPPPDEGIRRSAQELAAVFAEHGAYVYAVTPTAPFLVKKLLATPRLLARLRCPNVRTVVYIPTQSSTMGTLLRARMLSLVGDVDVVVVALQPRSLRWRSS